MPTIKNVIRFPLFLVLALFAPGAAVASSRAPHAAAAVPADLLAAAHGVARALIPPGSRSSEARQPVRNVAPAPPATSAPGDPRAPYQIPDTAPPLPLALSSAHAVVPWGETRVVTIIGASERPDVTADPVEVVTTIVTPTTTPGLWSLTLRGLAAGKAELHVTAADREQLLSVQVMKYAARVVPAMVEVTGQPAPAEFVMRAARAVVDDAVKLEPGAMLSIGNPLTAPPELPAGQAAAISFPVTVTGPDLLPVKATAAVMVRNRDLEQREVGVLLYSNEPERVERAGTLFAAELTPDRPARLLYHHQNAGQEPLRLRLELVNPTDEPADVQVIEGAAGPTWDPVEAGHRAAARYIRSALLDVGTIVRVPARSQQAITIQRMLPGNTVSGLFGLRSLGARLFVRVVAEAAMEPAVALRPVEAPGALSDSVYLSPRRPLSAHYVVGKNWSFLKLGADPVAGRGSHKRLAGNYGVSYELTLELSNPMSQPQAVALVLSPDAGNARGVFVIDGVVVEAPAVGPPVEADLATFRLQPGERRSVRVLTIPVGGSSYPARLVIRPSGPLRTAEAAADDK